VGGEGVQETGVDAFDGHRTVAYDLRDRVGGSGRIGIAEDQQHVGLRGGDECEAGTQHGDAGAFGPGEGAGDVHAVLWQQPVEVVAGDAARETREALPDQCRVPADERLERGVDLAFASRGRGQGLQPVPAGGAEGEAGAVVAEHVEFADIVGGGAEGDRVRAACVVADHAAERRAGVGGRVRAEPQPVLRGGGLQVVQRHPRFDPGDAGVGVDGQDAVEVAARVEHDPGSAGVSGDAGARAARRERHTEFTGRRHRRDDVVRIAGGDHGERHLPVVGRVGGVQDAGRGVEVHIAAHGLAQQPGEAGGVGIGT
jgi:hypothetical protein